MLHLLTIKVDQDYIRCTKGRKYELCTLDKASVWPKSKLEIVQDEFRRVKDLFPSAKIYSLLVTEEIFSA